MTDPTLQDDARKVIEAWEYHDALDGTHLQPREIERLAQRIAAHTQAAVEREREQCAREVEGYEGYPNVSHAKVAAAIRQRASGENT